MEHRPITATFKLFGATIVRAKSIRGAFFLKEIFYCNLFVDVILLCVMDLDVVYLKLTVNLGMYSFCVTKAASVER